MAVHASDDVTLKMGNNASPEVFTAIGQVMDVTGPTKTMNVLTSYFIGSDLPTKTPSNYELGQASFELEFDADETQQAALSTARDNKTLKNFQLSVSTQTADILAFSGYVTEVNNSISQGDSLKGSVTIEVTSYTAWA